MNKEILEIFDGWSQEQRDKFLAAVKAIALKYDYDNSYPEHPYEGYAFWCYCADTGDKWDCNGEWSRRLDE